MLAASEDGNVYCYSLKSGKFKRKYEGHNAAVTCLSVIECSGSSTVGSDTEGTDGEQIAPDLFFTGSLDEHLRLFSFKVYIFSSKCCHVIFCSFYIFLYVNNCKFIIRVDYY